jgi:hypothetical protein
MITSSEKATQKSIIRPLRSLQHRCFLWALNSADTAHPGVELSVLVATAVAFLMAVVIPDAFTGGGAWFAVT